MGHRRSTIFVRPRASPDDAVPLIAGAIRGMRPNLPFVELRPIDDLADVQTRSWRLGATTFGLLAVSWLSWPGWDIWRAGLRCTPTAAGNWRAHGSRRDATGVVGAVFRHGLFLVALGWVLGSVVIMVMTRSIRSLLFNVAPSDSKTFMMASLAISVTGLAGSVVRHSVRRGRSCCGSAR